ncbi:MAG: hypothetical protein HYT79_02575 [Elusimicrobia bacterium]|nr:hypothetical protein [Elusimicrobiota bacterium]
MRNVSQEYQTIQKSNFFKPARKIELFRRLSDGSGWEASAIVITSEIIRLDRLSWKLDTDNLNEFKASNIRIEVDNSDRRWDEGSAGRFAGFLRFHSKIRISLGLEVNGSNEIFSVFTGLIEDINEDSRKPALELDIRSLDQILEDADAEKAAVTVANETVGTGDGNKTDFPLAQKPVGRALEVKVGSAVARPGLDYTVTGLNDPTQAAIIKFKSGPPASGSQIKATYLKWKTNLRIHEAVNDLLSTVPQIEKQIVEIVRFDPAAQREIAHTLLADFQSYDLRRAQAVAEPSGPAGNGRVTIKPFETEAEWNAALVKSRINLKRVSNAVHPKWTSQYEGDFLPTQEYFQAEDDATMPWEEFFTGSALPERQAQNSILTINHTGQSDASYYALNTFRNEGGGVGLYSGPRSIFARFRADVLSGEIRFGCGMPESPYLGAIVKFPNLTSCKVTSGSSESSPISVDVTQFHVYRLDFNLTSLSVGTWKFFIDGSERASGTLQSVSGTSTQLGGMRLESDGHNRLFIDFIRFNAAQAGPAKGEVALKVDYSFHLAGIVLFNLISTMGPFFAELQGSSSGAKFFWSWSQDDLSYSAETEVSIGGNIGNWTNVNSPRFIKMRVVLTDTAESQPYALKKLWLPALAISPLVDGGADVLSWDTWLASFASNDGGVSFFSAAEANSQSGYSFYQARGAGDAIKTDDFAVTQGFSMPTRLIFITLLNTAGASAPMHNSSAFIVSTSTVLLSMANYAGRSVLDVIKEMAKLADFEIGLDSEGGFFFRNKTTFAQAVLTLDSSNVLSVQSFSPGWDRVFNSIRASFGQFVAIADSQSEGDPSPTSNARFGVRDLSVGGGSLVFETDVDLSKVLSKRYFTRYKEPKRRATVIARFMPEVELGDRVGFDVPEPWRIAQAFDARVLGIAHDLMGMKTELDLLEV